MIKINTGYELPLSARSLYLILKSREKQGILLPRTFPLLLHDFSPSTHWNIEILIVSGGYSRFTPGYRIPARHHRFLVSRNPHFVE